MKKEVLLEKLQQVPDGEEIYFHADEFNELVEFDLKLCNTRIYKGEITLEYSDKYTTTKNWVLVEVA